MPHTNLEDRDLLPLAFDKSMSSSKATDSTLVCPGYFISLVPAISGEHSLISHLGRHPMGE
jgi:hypothetical protein